MAFLLTSFLHWSNAEQYVFVRLFSYFMPWFLAILVPGALLSLTLRHYGLFTCFLLPIAYITLCYGPLFLPKQSATKTGRQIKVISFNVWSKNTNMEAVSTIIKSETPDILFLQEISQPQFDQLIHLLQSSQSNHLLNVDFDSDRMLALLSRFPLVALDSPGTNRTMIQKVRVASDKGDILAFNVHFIRGYRQKRSEDIERFIKEELADNQDPVLLAGDLNTTSHTSIYQSLSAIMKNSHDEAGWGFGFTYPASLRILYRLPLPAMVRIDHVFYSSHFNVTAAETLSKSGGSDHYPVLAAFVFSP